MEKFVIPVLHVGGRLDTNNNGVLSYLDGEVHTFDAIDADTVNIPDLEAYAKSLGFPTYTDMYWLEPTVVNLEFGLRDLKGDGDVNQLRRAILESDCVDFEIFLEHPISVPVEAEGVEVNVDGGCVNLDSDAETKSSSHDSYESAEDEAYKPPPEGYELSSDSDCGKRKTGKKGTRTKKILTPKKKGSPKKKVSRTPPKNGSGEGNGLGEAEHAEAENGGEQVKKKPARKYAGKRMQKRRPDFGPSSCGSGPSNNVSGPSKGGSGPSNVSKDGPTVVEPIVDEVDSEAEKEYVYESEQFVSPISSDEDGVNRHRWTQHNTGYGYGEVYFELGMEFDRMIEFREALKDYFVFEGKECRFHKNEPKRVRAGCAIPGCPFLIFCSENTRTNCYQVKTFVNKHTCGKELKSNLADCNWVASKLVKVIVTRPDLTPKEAKQHMNEVYNIQIHERMISRALKRAREKVIGKEGEQYNKLHDYVAELLKSNPGTTVLLSTVPKPEGLPLFDRLYISLEACKLGFKAGCRRLIGLDGCFLKGYYGGQLLSAVAQDANNHIFVVAYAVVDSENTDSWKWFLTMLKEDLGDVCNEGLEFMSDQQKGLLAALNEVMPNSNHRNCVLHIWKNFTKKFKDKASKSMVWRCARTTTPPQFETKMLELKELNFDAWEHLMRFPPSSWTKAHFNHTTKIDNITNNMCEVWNAKIVGYRGKPILTLCEELRRYVMRKMANHKRKLCNFPGKLAPVQQQRLHDKIIPASAGWNALWSGDNEMWIYQVELYPQQLSVNLKEHTCTCNRWQLTGLPCKHAVAAIAMHRNGGYIPEDFAHKSLTMEAVKATYNYMIQPVPSQEYWTSTGCEGIEPPPIVRPAGRPRSRRFKDHVEMIIGNKVRKTCQVTCSKCGEKGHYYKTCKGAPRDPNWKTKSSQNKRKTKQNEGSQAENGVPPNATLTGNSNDVQQAPIDPVEKAKKNKKKKPRVATVSQAEEMDLSQSAPTPEPFVPPPEHFTSTKFRMKQPIVRPYVPPSSRKDVNNPKEPQQYRFMPTPGLNPPSDI